MNTTSAIGSEVAADYATKIVAAYVGRNAINPTDLPKFIGDVYAAVSSMGQGAPAPAVTAKEPAVPIKRSVLPDFIICLEDGLKFKSLKRHLRTAYSMTPEQYREKWNLPADYPMVAPNYANSRSKLAKNMGLGQRKAR